MEKLFILNLFALLLCIQNIAAQKAYAEKIDTTAIEIVLSDYFDAILESKFSIGDTISMKTLFNTEIKILPYDSIGTIAIYELHKDKSISYKEYIGTGIVLYFPESYADLSSDTVQVTTRVHRSFEQKKNGTWKKWDKEGNLTYIGIYQNDKLLRENRL